MFKEVLGANDSGGGFLRIQILWCWHGGDPQATAECHRREREVGGTSTQDGLVYTVLSSKVALNHS